MGVFDESICNCCVCPMQCVLEQLVGQEVQIITLISASMEPEPLFDVKNFIAFSEIGEFPVCNINAVSYPATLTNKLKLKNTQKNTGECVCCENSITRQLNKMIGQEVEIEFLFQLQPIVVGTIFKVGKGIVLLDQGDSDLDLAISTCAITRIIPTTSTTN
ncbi:hypothetical protein [Chengkuizengella axinellae]|uniref:Uncharacterized protein n=1 Tax=Chengkuizengella axinellae TaxID=3064388 RepID=A0ABT9IV47_9BACL|nr:hypothetical protein [Chengkuizengella sp. 2205SS18-9]MDP5273236.1 hypothetical protein [Chengkuizengella sp. 2205SS18-9]